MLFAAVEGAESRSYRRFVTSQSVGEYDTLIFVSWKEGVPAELRDAFLDVKIFEFDVYSDFIREASRLAAMFEEDVTALINGRDELSFLLMLALSFKSHHVNVKAVLDLSGYTMVEVPLRGVVAKLDRREERILKLLSSGRRWSLRKIARRVRLSHSTVHRIIRSLNDRGYLRGYELTEAGRAYLTMTLI